MFERTRPGGFPPRFSTAPERLDDLPPGTPPVDRDANVKGGQSGTDSLGHYESRSPSSDEKLPH